MSWLKATWWAVQLAWAGYLDHRDARIANKKRFDEISARQYRADHSR